MTPEKTRRFAISLLLPVLLLLSTAPAVAVLNIEIVGGREGGQPIAIVPFGIQGGLSVSEDLASIITSDLGRSGRFDLMPVNRMPGQPVDAVQIDFAQWQAANMPYMVIGRIMGSNDSYNIEFQLFDTFQGNQMAGLRYTANNKTTLRRVAHQISDVIYETLLGEKSVFATRIAYITARRLGNSKSEYHLYVADADGANPNLMLRANEPIFSPDWSPDGQRIAYASLEGKKSAVYVQEVRSGTRRQVSAYPHMNSSPAWAPDGQRLALTLSKDGNAEIYVLNLLNNGLQRITNNPAIDTEADWSPDGSSLFFTSDRSGGPQIYRVSANGGTAQRITFQGNYNARPRVSPDGQSIAMVHRGSGSYNIALFNLNNNQFNVLTQTSQDESPSFAPNGSMILYGSGRELAAVSTDGRVRQRLAVDIGESVREPAWSPF